MPSPYSHTPSGTPGEPQRRRLPPPALLRAVLGPALAMAAGLSLLRLALWLCQGTWGRGLPLYRTLWDAAGAVTAGLASALAAGLIASVSLVALMGRAGPLLSQAQAVGHQRIARAMLLASLPLILALTVLPLAGGHLAMDLRAASLAAFLPPFLVIVLCPLLLVLASHASLRCGTGLCISVLTISVLAERALAGTHEAVELRAELLLDEGGWSTLEGDPEHPPWVGVLTPSMEQRREKADLPSLFLPPPPSSSWAPRRPAPDFTCEPVSALTAAPWRRSSPVRS